jgi:hypothetical protein
VLCERVTLAHMIWHISARFFTKNWFQNCTSIMLG